MLAELGSDLNLASGFKCALILLKDVQLHDFHALALKIVVRTLSFLLLAHQCLSQRVELLSRLLVSRLVDMAPILASIGDLMALLTYDLFVEELSCESVPKGDDVEAINCGHQVLLLLPEQVVADLTA